MWYLSIGVFVVFVVTIVLAGASGPHVVGLKSYPE